MREPRLRRGAAFLVAVFTAVVLPAAVASAHAELRESTPAAGAQLAEPPPVISLRFTEDVELLDDAVTLLDAAGSPVELGEPMADGATVTVSVPDLADGAYVVDWKVVSADGHPVSGAFSFTVGDAAPIDPEMVGGSDASSSSSSSASLIVWRALTYAGFAVVLGVWAFVLACWPDGRRDRVVLLLLAVGALVALFASVLRAVTEASVLDASLAEMFDLRSGRAWLTLIVLATLSFGVGPLLRSRIGRWGLGAVWVVGAAAVGVAIAYAGHGASGRIAVLGTILTAVHVAAGGVWIGGLVALVRCFVAVDRPTAWGVAMRFSSLALVLVAVLAVTGTIQAVRQLVEIDALTESDFGRALLIKLAVIAGLLGVAWLSRLAVRRSAMPPTAALATTRLRRTVGAELALAAAVFGVTGWLAGASPNPPAEASGPATVTAADATGTATATATITPALTGPNSIHVTIDDPEGRTPDEVQMELAPVGGQVAPIDANASVMPGMVMSDRVDIPFAGEWTLTIDARFGDFELLTFELPFTVS